MEQLNQKTLQESKNIIAQLNSLRENEIVTIFDNRRLNMMNALNKYLAENTAMSKQNQQAVKEWISILASSDDMTVGAIKNIQEQFSALDALLCKTGETGLSTKDRLKQIWKQLYDWSIMKSGVSAITNQIQKIPEEVYKIDAAMTKLRKSTNETKEKYAETLDTANALAQELGSSVSDLVEQTANWTKLGYNIDDAGELAMTSSIYANIGEIDDEKATSDLAAALKAFHMEAENSMSIIDQLNKLGHEFSASSSELGDELSKSASAMALGGNSLEQTLALLSGGAEITKTASELGSALTISQLRVMGMTEALEELGEGYEELESGSQMRADILNLTNGQINITTASDPNKLKSYYDILESIAGIFDSLDQTKQSDLLEALFGKKHKTQGTALIQAFQSGEIQKALSSASNAQGSAMQEQERWLEGLEAKIKQFEAAFQSLSETVLDSGLLKSIFDFGRYGLNALDGLAGGINELNSLFGLLDNSMGGTLGAISGLLMNQAGIGERTKFQW